MSEPYIIPMTASGAIAEGKSAYVVPDGIKLERASYPRMIPNPIQPWTNEDSPPASYGTNILDDSFEEDWYYTFYCDSVSWDGDSSTMDTSGNGTEDNPWKNLHHALLQMRCMIQSSCCRKFRIMVSGVVDYSFYNSDMLPASYRLNSKNIVLDFTDCLCKNGIVCNYITNALFFNVVWEINDLDAFYAFQIAGNIYNMSINVSRYTFYTGYTGKIIYLYGNISHLNVENGKISCDGYIKDATCNSLSDSYGYFDGYVYNLVSNFLPSTGYPYDIYLSGIFTNCSFDISPISNFVPIRTSGYFFRCSFSYARNILNQGSGELDVYAIYSNGSYFYDCSISGEFDTERSQCNLYGVGKGYGSNGSYFNNCIIDVKATYSGETSSCASMYCGCLLNYYYSDPASYRTNTMLKGCTLSFQISGSYYKDCTSSTSCFVGCAAGSNFADKTILSNCTITPTYILGCDWYTPDCLT